MRLFVLLVSAFLTALSGNAALARGTDKASVATAAVQLAASSDVSESMVARPAQDLASRVERWASLPRAFVVAAQVAPVEDRLRL